MAKAGFRVMDSDIHVIEPHDLWQRTMASHLIAVDGLDPRLSAAALVPLQDPRLAADEARRATTSRWPTLPAVASDSKRKILWDNCLRLYALEEAE